MSRSPAFVGTTSNSERYVVIRLSAISRPCIRPSGEDSAWLPTLCAASESARARSSTHPIVILIRLEPPPAKTESGFENITSNHLDPPPPPLELQHIGISTRNPPP